MKKTLKAKNNRQQTSIYQKLTSSLLTDKRRTLVWLIILASLLFIAFRITSTYFDKQRFLKAEVKLQEVQSQIEAKIGKADQEKYEKFCGHANLKFNRGPLVCSISRRLFYLNKDTTASTNMMNAAASLFGPNVQYYLGGNNTSFTPFGTLSSNADQSFSQEIPQMTSLGCYAHYIYSLKVASSGQPTNNVVGNFQVHLICSGSAKSEYFLIK